jgi:hypothetical protein
MTEQKESQPAKTASTEKKATVTTKGAVTEKSKAKGFPEVEVVSKPVGGAEYGFNWP